MADYKLTGGDVCNDPKSGGFKRTTFIDTDEGVQEAFWTVWENEEQLRNYTEASIAWFNDIPRHRRRRRWQHQASSDELSPRALFAEPEQEEWARANLDERETHHDQA